MRKILIVDDVEVNRKVLRRMLEREYDILDARGGEEALCILSREYENLSAVVLDLLMPDVDGYKVLRRMRENPQLVSLPVLVVTGCSDEQSRMRALSLGANDFVAKPYNVNIIRHCLRNNIALCETAAAVHALERDRLTGVFSREAFFERAARILRSEKPGTYLLASYDIDNFKLINDRLGMAEGDRILKHIGTAFSRLCEGFGGVCGRISGDNFAGIYPNTKEATEYAAVCRESRFLPPDLSERISYSVGRYVVTDLSLSVSSMYDRACIAMQSVKGMYGKHMAYFDDSMLSALLREERIAGEMESALADEQFVVYFQPQHNYATGALIGAEALVRWQHPELGLVPPASFIPVFEQNGFIYELDKYVWERTCRYLRQWLDEGRRVLPVSVNISRCDVFQDDLLEVLLSLVQRYDLPMELLRLEITESAFEESTAQIAALVEQMTARGFLVGIDDFGSGYSSLNTLKDVPANVLKLDLHFLESSTDTERSGSILEAVVRMARWIGISVLAEGVETRQQADFLKSIGCNYMQGFLFARPMPAEEYEAYFSDAAIEGKMLELETVEHLDQNRFWDPDSLDTLVFNRFVGGACILEYADGRAELMRCNAQYLKELRVKSGEPAATPGWEPLLFLDEENRGRALSAINRAISHRCEASCEIFLPGHTGGGIYFSLALRTIAKAGESYLLYCCVTNITEQRSAERRRLQTAKQLQLLTDSISGGISTYVCTAGRIRLTYFNDGLCALFGLSREEYAAACKTNPFCHVFAEDYPPLRRQFEGLRVQNTPMLCTIRVHSGDGGMRYLKICGSITERSARSVTVNTVALDVTAEQVSAEQLRMRETEYTLAVRICGSVICRYLIPRRTLTMGPEAAALLNLPTELENAPAEIVRRGMIAPENAEAFIAFFGEIEHGIRTNKALFQWKLPSGWRWQQMQYSTVFSDAGEPVSAVLSLRDVTDELEKENVYIKWQQSLQQRDADSYSLFRCNMSKRAAPDVHEGRLLSIDFDEDVRSFDERTQIYADACVAQEDREAFVSFLSAGALLDAFYRGVRSDQIEYREALTDGGRRWIRLSLDMVKYPSSTDVEAFLLFENIDREKRAELLTAARALTDALTGVLDRIAFAEQMSAAIERESQNACHALLMLDLDGFKQVNDVLGHAAGDQTLIDTANHIRAILRKDDLLGRLGGDEFVVFLRNIPSDRIAAEKAAEICSLTRRSLSSEVFLSSSIGIAVYPRDGLTFEALYKRADAGLYHVKDNGKDGYAFFSAVPQEEQSKH